MPGHDPQASRRERQALLALFLPTLGGQVAQTANGFVDAVMAGAVGPRDLAAVAVGASIWVPVYLFITGVVIAATPLLSQRLGAGRHAEVGPLAWQALWLALLAGLCGSLAVLAAPALFDPLQVPEPLQEITGRYLAGLAAGMPAAGLFIGLRSYSESVSHTRPMLVISVIGLLANIPLNAWFIHGGLGVPAMGGAGCGLATAVVMWLMAILMGLHVLRGRYYRALPAGNRLVLPVPPPRWPDILHIGRLGLPIGLAIFFEVSIFAVIAMLVSRFGEQVVAGHQIALNLASLTFMVPLSVAMALTVRTGYAAGARDLRAVQLAIRTGMRLILLVALLNVLLLLALRELAPALYTKDTQVRELAALLLVYAALFQLPDALQVAASGVLRGFRDTRHAMLVTLFSYWCVGLPVGCALGFGLVPGIAAGPQGFWAGLIAGLTVAAVLLNRRVWRYYRGETVLHRDWPPRQA